jgi:hypothetical protein
VVWKGRGREGKGGKGRKEMEAERNGESRTKRKKPNEAERGAGIVDSEVDFLSLFFPIHPPVILFR